MTTPPVDPRSLEEMLREDTDVDALEEQYTRAVDVLAGDARSEAAAAGRQLRGIHRMWRLQEEAHEQRRAVLARWMNARSRRCGRDREENRSVLEVADEIGPVLRLPAVTAVRWVEHAIGLAESLPAVLTALEDGVIGRRQAEVVVETWVELLGGALRPAPQPRPPEEAVRQLVEDLLRRAPASTAAQLRARARRGKEELLRNTQEQRHRQALLERRVWVEAAEDGMATVCALLDAATAHAVHDRLVAIAGRVDPAGPQTPPDPAALPDQPWPCGVRGGGRGAADAENGPQRRTPAQMRADVLADLLLEGEPPAMPEHLRGIRGQVSITVPALALLAHTEHGPGDPGAPSDPGAPVAPAPAGRPGGDVPAGGLPGAVACAELAGYGPIPMELAARIAATAPSWTRVLTHPLTGTVIDHDRTVYAVPADLKRRLRLRDGTCRFPGCRRAARRCDLDHTVAWAEGGPTAAGNLAHLCRAHHLLKHRDGPLGRWRVAHRDPRTAEGVLEWTSPAGRIHVTYPQEHHHRVLTPLRIRSPLPEDPLPEDPLPEDPPLGDPQPSGVLPLWQIRQLLNLSPLIDDPPPF